MAQATDPVTTVADQLRNLVGRGFRFIHPRTGEGELVAVVGVRAHDHVVDVVEVRTETDVVATRMPADVENVLAPTDVLWRTTGPASTVLAELLTLPDDHLAAGHLDVPPNGCWVPIHAGRSRWLAPIS
ncbi:MAG TPA: hypothetical protein VEO01_37370 [Pseudonocardiaceae bacterium]|nr:hypothetical protein [Pseudonocardiaceae bacterium]